MKRPFEFDNYRNYLIDLAAFRDTIGRTRAELANAMNCQPAYFSQVLKGRAELTEDQGIQLCQFLSFSASDTEYFMILLRQERAATPALKRYLETQRLELLRQHGEVSGRLGVRKKALDAELSAYYSSNWLPSVIHIATSCERLQTIRQIAEHFILPEDTVEFHLRELQKYHLVEYTDDRWQYAGQSIHFPKNSTLDLQFQMSRRLLAMSTLSVQRKADLHYAVVFATDQKTFATLRARFLEMIEELHRTVEPTPSDDVYTICIDAFPVTRQLQK